MPTPIGTVNELACSARFVMQASTASRGATPQAATYDGSGVSAVAQAQPCRLTSKPNMVWRAFDDKQSSEALAGHFHGRRERHNA